MSFWWSATTSLLGDDLGSRYRLSAVGRTVKQSRFEARQPADEAIDHLGGRLSKTVVIVLHDINFAARYADHIVAMKDGQIFKAADTEAVIQEQVLASLYEIPIKLVQVDGRQFCYTFQ